MIVRYAQTFAMLAALAALPAAAQETAPAAKAAPGDGAAGIGEIYVAATHGDWELRCERTETGTDPCVMNQLLINPEGLPMADITIRDLPPGNEIVALGTIVTPIETLLSKRLKIQVTGEEARSYTYSFCYATPLRAPDGGALLNANGVPELDSGCVAQVGFTTQEVDAFRKGAEAQVTIFSYRTPDQPFTATLSLAGFTAGFKAMQDASAKAAPAADQ